jgi:hypothetical protein
LVKRKCQFSGKIQQRIEVQDRLKIDVSSAEMTGEGSGSRCRHRLP